MAHYEKRFDIFGQQYMPRPNVEPAPQPKFTKETSGMFVNLDSSMFVNLDGNVLIPTLHPGKIDSEAIEDAVLKILEKHGVYSKTIDPNIGYEKELNVKTFTLDEVIKIIEFTPKRLDGNTVGTIWENKSVELVDKYNLIQKFKEA